MTPTTTTEVTMDANKLNERSNGREKDAAGPASISSKTFTVRFALVIQVLFFVGWNVSLSLQSLSKMKPPFVVEDVAVQDVQKEMSTVNMTSLSKMKPPFVVEDVAVQDVQKEMSAVNMTENTTFAQAPPSSHLRSRTKVHVGKEPPRQRTSPLVDLDFDLNDQSESMIHDKTLPWDSTVHREWLAYEKGEGPKPAAMILLTNSGWNIRDQTKGLELMRSIRNAELVTGVINHPWFHPTFWEDVEEGRRSIPHNDTTHYYIFLDRPLYGEGNYPIYGGNRKNLDTRFGRSNETANDSVNEKHLGKKLIVQAKGRFRIIHWNGGGYGMPRHRRSIMSKLPFSYVPVSDLISNVDPKWDQGITPPAPKASKLTLLQDQDIDSCAAETKRRFFLTYVGNMRSGPNKNFTRDFGGARSSYYPFHDNQTVFVSPPRNKEFLTSPLYGMQYEAVLQESVFALAPRGDNKFSYRFSEVMSAAAIPVIHADDWLWPFRPELVDWNECAVIAPEKDAGNTTLHFLREMSLEERCRRRKKCLQIYRKYMETPVALVSGLIEGLELVANNVSKPLIGVKCSDYNYGPECNMGR